MTRLKTLNFNGGLTCALQCSKLGESIAWYQKILGFELLFKVDDLAWAELRTPVNHVQLGIAEVENPQTQGGATLTWGVEDIDISRAQLEKHDVKFDGDTQTIPGIVRLATFFDLDGNRHMFYQDLQSEGLLE